MIIRDSLFLLFLYTEKKKEYDGALREERLLEKTSAREAETEGIQENH